MSAGVIIDSSGEGRYSPPRHVYWQEAGNSYGVGGVASYLGGL